MQESILQQPLLYWMLGLVFGLAFLVIVLGEIAERFRQNGNPLVRGVLHLRHLVLPFLAIALLMRYIAVPGSDDIPRLVETIFWLGVIYTGLVFINNVGQFGTLNPDTWVANIPTLVLALGRTVVIASIGYFVLTGLWGVDISSIVAAVGVGSLVIAFALQSTLSNIVSGFLLLTERPFNIGDWIMFEGDWMQVQAVNWRAVRLWKPDNGQIVIPSSVLADSVFINYGQEGAAYRAIIYISFSYNDPPHRVKQIMRQAILTNDLVLRDRPMDIRLNKYEDSSIRYRLRFWVGFWDYNAIFDIQENIYYAAKRNGLTFQYPTQVQYNREAPELPPLSSEYPIERIEARLRASPIFSELTESVINDVAKKCMVLYYGTSEYVVRQGEADSGFYIIQSGEMKLLVKDKHNEIHELARLGPGEVFGEMVLLRNMPSPVSVRAHTDVEAFVIDHELMSYLISNYPAFAIAMEGFIEKRKKAIRDTLNLEKSTAVNGRTPQ